MKLKVILIFSLAFTACGKGGEPGPATEFVLSDLAVLPPEEGLDLDGDGSVDNVVGVLGLSEQGINSLLRSVVQDGQFLLLLRIDGLESPDDDDTLTVSFFTGSDTDGESENNLTGRAELAVSGDPVASGAAVISAGVLDVVVPQFTVMDLFELHDVRVRADGHGTLRRLDEGILAGGLPANALAAIDAGSTSGLDMLAVNYELIADLDTDGDGLERFEDSDADGRIDSCTDGDGSISTGTECALDARFPDAFSAAFRIEAVPCRIVEGS